MGVKATTCKYKEKQSDCITFKEHSLDKLRCRYYISDGTDRCDYIEIGAYSQTINYKQGR